MVLEEGEIASDERHRADAVVTVGKDGRELNFSKCRFAADGVFRHQPKPGPTTTAAKALATLVLKVEEASRSGEELGVTFGSKMVELAKEVLGANAGG